VRSAAPAATGTAPLLVCFGDSLTAGAGIEPSQAYPAILQQRLRQQGYDYKVINAGVSGNTTKDGVDRLNDVLRLHPQVVVVEFGGNDGLRGLPVSQAERNLDLIVSKLKASGAKVAMAGITLPPQYGGPYIQSFNQMFPEVANRYHVPLLPFILQDVFGVPGDIQDDGVHPTAKGAQQVAVNVERLVLPLLNK
jgi:acyl-CoA thioesterase-1